MGFRHREAPVSHRSTSKSGSATNAFTTLMCKPSAPLATTGGGEGIRTLDPLRDGGFQDRCLQPLGHPSGQRIIPSPAASSQPSGQKRSHRNQGRLTSTTNLLAKPYQRKRQEMIASKLPRCSSHAGKRFLQPPQVFGKKWGSIPNENSNRLAENAWFWGNHGEGHAPGLAPSVATTSPISRAGRGVNRLDPGLELWVR